MDWLTGGDDGIAQAWTASFQDTINPVLGTVVLWGVIVATLLFLLTLLVAVRRRRVICPDRNVRAEVDVEEYGLPGFRHATAVVACSLFEPRTSVRCQRTCLTPRDRIVREARASHVGRDAPAMPLRS
jgi:hypothetical protein